MFYRYMIKIAGSEYDISSGIRQGHHPLQIVRSLSIVHHQHTVLQVSNRHHAEL
jgi:hypothetical protein